MNEIGLRRRLVTAAAMFLFLATSDANSAFDPEPTVPPDKDVLRVEMRDGLSLRLYETAELSAASSFLLDFPNPRTSGDPYCVPLYEVRPLREPNGKVPFLRANCDIYIPIERRDDDRIEFVHLGRTYFLKASGLPKDGWEIRDSTNTVRLREDRVAKEVAPFLEDVRKCLLSKEPKGCLAPFLTADFRYSAENGAHFDSREALLEGLGEAEKSNLLACLLLNVREFYGSDYLLDGQRIQCDLEKVGERWVLASFSEGGCY